MRAAQTGKVRSEETRAKMSAAKKGKPGRRLSETEVEALRVRMAGRTVSEETRERQRQAKLKNPVRYWEGKTRGPMPEEQRVKIAESNTGKVMSEESKTKIAASLKGHKAHHGKRVPYNGTIFRSTYEARFAACMDRRQIEWHYESKRFDLGSVTYCPDFYLPAFDRYVEIKGWLGPDSIKKLTLFKQKFSEVNLVVVMKADLESFEQADSLNLDAETEGTRRVNEVCR